MESYVSLETKNNKMEHDQELMEKKEEFVKLLMTRVIHECIKEEPNTWKKKWTKLSKVLSLNLIIRLGYQKTEIC